MCAMNMIKARVIPPDGGWGWFVVLGSWIIDLLVFGFFRGGGVVFIECVKYFGSTRSEAAWIPVLTVAVSFLMAPVAGMLVYYYPYRLIVFLGGMTATSGLVICHYAPTITFVYIGYGVILGAGFGLVLSPHLSIVGVYFNRHRALATGITISGGAVGTFAVGPLVQYLIDEYGLRGAFLILSAILLHLCVAGTLYRPLDYIVTSPPSIQISEDEDGMLNGGLKLQVYSDSPHRTSTQERTHSGNPSQTAEDDTNIPEVLVNGTAIIPKMEAAKEEINQNEYDFEVNQNTMNQTEHDVDEKQLTVDPYSERLMAPLADIDETKITESDALSEDLLDRALHFSSQRTSRGVSMGSVMTLPKIVITSADGMAFTPSQSAEVLNVAITPVMPTEYVPPTVRIPAPPVKFFLFDGLLLLVSLSYGITVSAYIGIVLILPDYIQWEVEGLTISDGMMCIAVASIGDLIARPTIGWLIDKLGVKKRFLYQGSLWIFGVLFLLFPLASSYSALLVLSILLGALYGVCLVHSPCFLADYFGPTNLPFTMGYMMAIAGLPIIFLGLVIGAIRDLTGSYGASCWILGSVLVFFSVLWFSQPVLLRRHKHQQAKYELEKGPIFL